MSRRGTNRPGCGARFSSSFSYIVIAASLDGEKFWVFINSIARHVQVGAMTKTQHVVTF